MALRASDGIGGVDDRGTRRHSAKRAAIDGNTLFVPLVNGRVQAINLAERQASVWEQATRWPTRRTAGRRRQPALRRSDRQVLLLTERVRLVREWR